MKALSLFQPYASLIFPPIATPGGSPPIRNQDLVKRVETRSWRVHYRGRFAVHASQGMPRWAVEKCSEEPFSTALAQRACGPSEPGGKPLLPRGAMLGIATLIDCIPTERVFIQNEDVYGPPVLIEGHLYINPAEYAFGDYRPGRWAWLLSEESNLFPTPIPAKGTRGFWDWEDGRKKGETS